MFLQKILCILSPRYCKFHFCEASLYFSYNIQYEYFKKGKKITLRRGTYQV